MTGKPPCGTGWRSTHEQTAPIVGYYREWERDEPQEAPRVSRIDGLGTLEDVRERILETLDRV